MSDPPVIGAKRTSLLARVEGMLISLRKYGFFGLRES
ncbi:hypothetical protein FHS27_001038 [Rhodopirellula rubra]|uniref:Uncharacterized protein n=1 Tax=Aporhodopirellula rubra TaxID=980271 RepID=A0A7W5H4J7_9BACT|nr:hypothetical protein [Aporhodopirellula rubra]